MNKTLIIACILSSFTISACISVDPNTGENKMSNTSKGSALGATAGALLGAATSSKKDRGKGVLLGGLAGAAVGGGAGYAMDQREKKLREKMENTGVQVERNGNELQLVIPGNISFDTGSYMLSQNFKPSLNKLAGELKTDVGTKIKVVGYTDSVGKESTNQELSYQRARSVALYIRNQGVSMDRFEIQGVGATDPVADNATAEGRAQNRRVVINLVPLAQARS